MWSIVYKRCETCPASTFAQAGDISCTRCSVNTYSIDSLPVCFPNGRIGGVIEFDSLFVESLPQVFQRTIATLLNLTSPSNVVIVSSRPSSTIYYFYLNDDNSKLNPLASALSGNEQMLLLYDTYVTKSPYLTQSQLPPILSFNLVALQGQTGGTGQLLLVPASFEDQPVAIVLPQPKVLNGQVVYLSNQGHQLSNSATTSLLVLFISFLVLFLLQ